MTRAIILAALILALATPAAAAPGPVTVVVATCRESVVIWQDAPDNLAGSYVYAVLNVSRHGTPYTVDMYYQYHSTLANGRAIYRAVDWQTTALKVETVTIGGGAVMSAGGAPLQEIDNIDTLFEMDCWHVFAPVVVR